MNTQQTYTKATSEVQIQCSLDMMLSSVFVLSYYVSPSYQFRVVMSVTISAQKRCSVRVYFQFFVGGFIFCFVVGACTQWCPTPIVLFLFFIICLRIVSCVVYPMLQVSLDCPFLIASFVFSNVYLDKTVMKYCKLLYIHFPLTYEETICELIYL